MNPSNLTHRTLAADAREHQDRLLDEALGETFPASDPIAIFVPAACKPAKQTPRVAPHRGTTRP